MERTYSTNFGGSAAFATRGGRPGHLRVASSCSRPSSSCSSRRWRRPASISLEREKQTLEMLAATPITSFAIVLGKLLSALIYVWLLIAASIPLTAIVFVFGGVAPDDLVRGYVVLIVTALGFGAFGLFCSSLVKRTQAATAIALFGVLAISMGTLFVIVFWNSLATPVAVRDGGPLKGAPPDVADLSQPVHRPGRHRARPKSCARRDSTLNAYCKFRSTFVLPDHGLRLRHGWQQRRRRRAGGSPSSPPPPIGIADKRLRDRRVVAELASRWTSRRRASVIAFGSHRIHLGEDGHRLVRPVGRLPLLSVQFVSPTRRWRLRRGPSAVPSPEADSMRIPSRPT